MEDHTGIEYLLRFNSAQQRKRFQSNTAVDFQCAIDHRHTFNNTYEVGVKEISIPQGVYNVPEDLLMTWYSTKDGVHWNRKCYVLFPAGYYKDIEDVVHELNLCIQEASDFQKYYSTYIPGRIPKFSMVDNVLTLEPGTSWSSKDIICSLVDTTTDCLDIPLKLEKLLGMQSSREIQFYDKIVTSEKWDLSYPFEKLYLKSNFTGDILYEILTSQLGTGLITIKDLKYIPVLDEVDIVHLFFHNEDGKRIKSDSYRGLITLSFKFLGSKTDYKNEPLADVLKNIV